MWNKLTDKTPNQGTELICFNTEWIDEDFNPNGTRVGFLNGENEFTTAYWWNYQDTYMTISKSETENEEGFSEKIKKYTEPTHWMEMPKRPMSIEEEVQEIIEQKGLDRAILAVRVWLSYDEKSTKFQRMLELLLERQDVD